MVNWERWENIQPTVNKKIDENNKIENPDHGSPILRAFDCVGLPLKWELEHMLSEADEHQGGRRGSGFTQATRVLADTINNSLETKSNLSLFDLYKIEIALKKQGGWDLVERTNKLDLVTTERFNRVLSLLDTDGHKKFVTLIMDLFHLRDLDKELPVLNASQNLSRIGTCTTAEAYFYDYLNPQPMWCRFLSLKNNQVMNIIVGEDGEPIFLEKNGIGEKTAIVLSPFVLNGCEIPEGSLVQIDYDELASYQKIKYNQGLVIPLAKIDGARFLRFTPLVSPPSERGVVFGSHIEHQKQNDMYNVDNITIQDFKDKIKEVIE